MTQHQKFQSPSVLIKASWYFAEKIIRLVGAFLVGAWVARHLGPSEYGALAYALAIVALLSFLGSLGIESVVVRDLVEGCRNQRGILSTYFFIRLLGSLFVPLFATGYLLLLHDANHHLLLLTLICSSSVVFGVFDTADCWLQANNEAKATSLIRLLSFIAGMLGRCLLLMTNASVEWFAGVISLESALVAYQYYRVLHINGLTPSLRFFSMDEFKHLVVAGKMMVLSGLANTVHSKIDVLVTGALLSDDIFGYYAVAVSMCGAWNMVGMSMVQAWAPRVTYARTSGRDSYIRELRRLLTAMLAISLVGSVALDILAPVIFETLLGPAYAGGSKIFSLLIWSSVPIYIGIATSQLIVNERAYYISMLRAMAGMAVTLVLMFPAIRHYGTQGAAAVVIIGASINAILILASKRTRQLLFSVMAS